MSNIHCFPSVYLHQLPYLTSHFLFKNDLCNRCVALCYGNINEIVISEEHLASLISSQQWSEAGQIANPRLKNRFLIIRAALNLFLSRFTEIKPADHHFNKTETGKPILELSPKKLHFNISHAEDFFLLAVAHDPVGIDLEEKKRKIPEWNEIIKRYYSPEEQADVMNSAYPEETFLKIWTAKEAVIKALGTGIHENMKNINTLKPAGTNNILHVYCGSINDCFCSIACPYPDCRFSFISAKNLF